MIDLNEFANEILDSDLATSAVLTVDETDTTIKVDFRNMFDDKGDAIIFEGQELYADAKTSDVSSANQGDTLTIDSTVYEIRSLQKFGDGFTRLILREQ